MRFMSHLRYLSDLPSRNFYLFLTVKEKLERIQAAEEGQLFEYQQEILGDINHDELNRAFRAWMQQFQEVNKGIKGHFR
jgi:hypothetical protein